MRMTGIKLKELFTLQDSNGCISNPVYGFLRMIVVDHG